MTDVLARLVQKSSEQRSMQLCAGVDIADLMLDAAAEISRLREKLGHAVMEGGIRLSEAEAKSAIGAEREACAKIADEKAKTLSDQVRNV